MDISNRSLVLLLIITVVLVGAAAVLTVGVTLGKQAPPPPAAPTEVSVKPEVTREGGEKKFHPEGPLIVHLDESATSGTAMLVCDMYKSERPFYKNAVGFDSIPFGDCSIGLSGSKVPFGPVYPGDELTCSVQGERTMCTGGIATEKAGSASVSSALPGTLEVDGEDQGRLPVTAIPLKVGKRKLVVKLDDGRKLSWSLLVQPEEKLTVVFPAPAGGAVAAPATDPAAPQTDAATVAPAVPAAGAAAAPAQP